MPKTFNAYTLKMVAIIGMLMQHTALVLGPLIPAPLHFPLQFGGGLTFPIMAFLLVEGYRHTSSVGRYLRRLFVFGLISQVPHMMAFSNEVTEGTGIFGINIMFTLFVGLLVLVMYDRMKRRGLFWFLFVVISLSTLMFDWGIVGPSMVLLYHVVKSEKLRRTIPPAIACWYSIMFAFGIGILIGLIGALDPESLYELGDAANGGLGMAESIATFLFPIGMLASIPLIRGYNGERGRSMKYLFYGFYPLHLLALALIAYFLGIGQLFGFI